MGKEFELRVKFQEPLYPLGKKILDFLGQNPGKLLTYGEISSAIWGQPVTPTRKKQIYNSLTRGRGLSPPYFYALHGFGAVCLPEDFNTHPLGLSELGVSLFTCGEPGEKVIPDLSVLGPKAVKNQLIGPEAVWNLLGKLVLSGKNRSTLILFLSPTERRVFACLANEGFHLAKELAEAVLVAPETVFTTIYRLQKKIAPVGLEIVFLKSQGYCLEKKVEPKRPLKSELLLEFFLRNKGLCLTLKKIWETVFGGSFDNSYRQANILSGYLSKMEERLRKRFPDEKWHLVNVCSTEVIYCAKGK